MNKTTKRTFVEDPFKTLLSLRMQLYKQKLFHLRIGMFNVVAKGEKMDLQMPYCSQKFYTHSVKEKYFYGIRLKQFSFLLTFIIMLFLLF